MPDGQAVHANNRARSQLGTLTSWLSSGMVSVVAISFTFSSCLSRSNLSAPYVEGICNAPFDPTNSQRDIKIERERRGGRERERSEGERGERERERNN